MLPPSFDTHTHLDFEAFDADRDAVVARARAAGVASWVIAGSDHRDWDRTERIARQTGGVAALGVHPWSDVGPAELDAALAELRRRDPAILGEIGLDALHVSDRGRQRAAFRAQLALARELNRPVILHCVRSYPEMSTVLRRDGLPAAGGVVHGWSGPADAVDGFVALGLWISFGPLILRRRAVKARASVVRVPADRLLLETDCPDQAPPGKGRGEPADLVDVAREAAALRGVELDRLWSGCRDNAVALFPALARASR